MADEKAVGYTPVPWTFRDAAGAGFEIMAPVYQVTGVELPAGMPSAPIQTFILTGPQVVQVAAERWVQFEPKGWHEMQKANAAFIVKAVNNFDAMLSALRMIQGLDIHHELLAVVDAAVKSAEK